MSIDPKQWSTVKSGGFKRYAPGIKSRRKRKKHSNLSIIPVMNGTSNGNISFYNLKQKTIKQTKYMEQTQLCKQLMINFKNISYSNYKLLCQHKQIHNPSLTIKINIICYGLGNFSKSLSSMQQISLLCAIISDLKNTNDYFVLNKVELFEPILTKIEKKVLKSFGIDILSNDTKGKYLINDNNNIITLCFMPHCPRILYNNLLATNWFNPYLLSKLYIIGNSFDQYYDLSISLNKNDKLYKETNWILMTHQFNIIKELHMDKWIDSNCNKKQNMDLHERDKISVLKNAFAFQKLLYFPMDFISKCNTSTWINHYDNMVTEQFIME